MAPSFIRVGHLDVLARRYRREQSDVARDELRAMIEHTLQREFAQHDQPHASLDTRIAILLRESGKGIAQMVADWLRVGFNQGNFNSDNCLVGGRTMDFGPFGCVVLCNTTIHIGTLMNHAFSIHSFIEQYKPEFVMVRCAQTLNDFFESLNLVLFFFSALCIVGWRRSAL